MKSINALNRHIMYYSVQRLANIMGKLNVLKYTNIHKIVAQIIYFVSVKLYVVHCRIMTIYPYVTINEIRQNTSL